ncbi:DUF6884 domain-containing protein [Shewanella sp. 10N.286.51.B8]|uniref:DUF6884 domain-containing protein n=1 Tax=Shewanella sp. 10N.286.51.B8 TaxID=3229708 RepID=UPI0035537383
MNVLVISSCTGAKAVDHEKAPTLEDFIKGGQHIESIHADLQSTLLPAAQLYTGQQHVRLMSAINELKDTRSNIEIDLYIVSAGYGVVAASQELPPYEVTFSGMKKKELREWSDKLSIANDFRKILSKPYDLVLILLGDSYIEACRVDDSLMLASPTIMFCGNSQKKKLPQLDNLKSIGLSNPEAKRFSCALVGLKGELAARLLRGIAKSEQFLEQLLDSNLPLEQLENMKVGQ